MCCLAEFIVKYALIIGNIVFALAGLAIVGLGVAVHIQIKDITELIPVNLNALSIGIIVLGCIVFVISFLACCGAMRESRCMLIFYALFMAILAGVKIWLAVVVFNFLDDVVYTVDRWIVNAFNNANVRPAFHVMETLFKCCGTTGSGSYAGVLPIIPESCCETPVNSQCTNQVTFAGCSTQVADFFEAFGEAIGAVLVVVIIVELVCVIFGLFLSCQIRQKKYASA